MHFYPGWSGPSEGFGHRGYYVGDGCYRRVGHHQDTRTPGQENQMVRNPKPEGLVSPKTTAVPNQQKKWWVPKDGASASRSGGSQDQMGLRSKASTNNNKAKPVVEKGLGEVAAELNRVLEEKTKAKTEAKTNSQ
jgi:hypothetical protein